MIDGKRLADSVVLRILTVSRAVRHSRLKAPKTPKMAEMDTGMDKTMTAEPMPMMPIDDLPPLNESGMDMGTTLQGGNAFNSMLGGEHA